MALVSALKSLGFCCMADLVGADAYAPCLMRLCLPLALTFARLSPECGPFNLPDEDLVFLDRVVETVNLPKASQPCGCKSVAKFAVGLQGGQAQTR